MSRRSAPQAVHGPGGAALVPDQDRPGAWTLLVDGTPQSHVDTGDPAALEFEYVSWLARLADALPGGPLGVVHLGGGAWTLARYVAATRPRSRQRVVELDAALVRFVREHLPPAGPGVRVREGDARAVLAELADASADLVVLDVFAGAQVPAHVTTVEFMTDVARVLRPGGVYAANLADGPPLAFARGQVATASAVFAEVAVLSEPAVLRGRRFGNLVVAGAREAGTLPIAALDRALAGEPFPARVVAGAEVVRFGAGARPVTDADAEPSPVPPDGWLR